MKKVKITVLRKEYYNDFAREYLTEGEETGACSLLNVGDSFIYEGAAKMPEGFCPWAWIDIYNNVSAIYSGATYRPWNKKDGQAIVCCTDGIRPVVFNVSRLWDQVYPLRGTEIHFPFSLGSGSKGLLAGG